MVFTNSFSVGASLSTFDGSEPSVTRRRGSGGERTLRIVEAVRLTFQFGHFSWLLTVPRTSSASLHS